MTSPSSPTATDVSTPGCVCVCGGGGGGGAGDPRRLAGGRRRPRAWHRPASSSVLTPHCLPPPSTHPPLTAVLNKIEQATGIQINGSTINSINDALNKVKDGADRVQSDITDVSVWGGGGGGQARGVTGEAQGGVESARGASVRASPPGPPPYPCPLVTPRADRERHRERLQAPLLHCARHVAVRCVCRDLRPHPAGCHPGARLLLDAAPSLPGSALHGGALVLRVPADGGGGGPLQWRAHRQVRASGLRACVWGGRGQ